MQAESPNYPRSYGDIVVRRTFGGVNGERTYFDAMLTDGFHNRIVFGSISDSETGALENLADAIDRKAALLTIRAEKLRASLPPVDPTPQLALPGV